MMVTIGGDRGTGQFLLAGGEELIAVLGPKYVRVCLVVHECMCVGLGVCACECTCLCHVCQNLHTAG